MATRRHVLSEETLKQLSKSAPEKFSQPYAGLRKISGQLLTPPSTIAMSDASRSVSAASSSSQEEYFEIPISMYSPQALEFVGFDVKTAGMLFDRWVGQPSEYEAGFLETIFGHLENFRGKNDDPPEEAKWHMGKMGISEKLMSSLMDPEFEDVRKSQSLWAWVREVMYINYLTLESLEERIMETLSADRNAKPVPNLRGGGNEAEDFYRKIVIHTNLYRATSRQRVRDLFKSDGNVRLETINAQFPLPNDFSNDKTAYYWTEEPWVADKYAGYLKRTTEHAEIVVIRMWCPNHLLQGEKVWKLQYGDNWKKLLWFSRLREVYPEDIKELHKDKEVIIGPISMVSDGALRKLGSWEKITERNLHKSQGWVGTQTVWIGMDAMASVNSWVKGKVDIYTRFPSMKLVLKPAEWTTAQKS